MEKSAIVAIAKNEELYLQEWIDYHKNLGFDYIFICDNNDLDNDGQLNLIKRNNTKCIGINVRGREQLEKVGYQTGLYKFSYNYIKENYADVSWIAFLDVDEFLDLDGMKVNQFLNQDKFKDADLIHVNWMCYGDNELVHYDPRPVMERFTKPLPIDALYDTFYLNKGIYINKHVKSIVRVNDNFKEFHTPHTVIFKNECKCVNVAGKPVDNTEPWQTICYEGGHIKHFITKSTEEFKKRKCMDNNRADATFNSKRNEEVEHYFSINTKTFAKWNIFNNLS